MLPLTNVEPHPNADRLDIAVVGNFRVIVPKGAYRPNDLVAYIPEGALLPEALIDELDIRNYLAGPQHNRVMATKLRGVLSQGLVYPARPARRWSCRSCRCSTRALSTVSRCWR